MSLPLARDSYSFFNSCRANQMPALRSGEHCPFVLACRLVNAKFRSPVITHENFQTTKKHTESDHPWILTPDFEGGQGLHTVAFAFSAKNTHSCTIKVVSQIKTVLNASIKTSLYKFASKNRIITTRLFGTILTIWVLLLNGHFSNCCTFK